MGCCAQVILITVGGRIYEGLRDTQQAILKPLQHGGGASTDVETCL
jgi:hypothetical protein